MMHLEDCSVVQRSICQGQVNNIKYVLVFCFAMTQINSSIYDFGALEESERKNKINLRKPTV